MLNTMSILVLVQRQRSREPASLRIFRALRPLDWIMGSIYQLHELAMPQLVSALCESPQPLGAAKTPRPRMSLLSLSG